MTIAATSNAPSSGQTIVQVALDVVELSDARRLAQLALEAGADWLEIGKPFVEFNGIKGCKDLISAFPHAYWLMDLLVMAAPARYVQAAAALGISNVTVSALAPTVTVATAIELGRAANVAITVDLFNVPGLTARVVDYAALEPDYLMVHFGVDQKQSAPQGAPIADLAAVVAAARCPVSYATYDIDESMAAVQAGAAIIVQGEPLLSCADPASALAEFVRVTKGVSVAR